jgi:hypothetical protein
LYLAGDIAKELKAAHPKNAPILKRLGMFCFIRGFEVADVLKAAIILGFCRTRKRHKY